MEHKDKKRNASKRNKTIAPLPNVNVLKKEVFDLVEFDQGRSFVPSPDYETDYMTFFENVRGWRSHTRRAADSLDAFLAKYGQL